MLRDVKIKRVPFLFVDRHGLQGKVELSLRSEIRPRLFNRKSISKNKAGEFCTLSAPLVLVNLILLKFLTKKYSKTQIDYLI